MDTRRDDIPLHALVLLLLVVGAYFPVFSAGWVWDDDAYVTDNRCLRSAAGLVDIWLDPTATPQYYPLVHTTFWIEYHLWRLDPFGYHLTNILLHGLASVLVWRVFRRLELPGATVLGAVFALHPVHVESVAWVTERKNVLSGLFYLGALLFYLRFLEGRRTREWWVSFLLFVLALLSKTVTCSLPVAILLIVWWRHGRVRPADAGPLVPFFAIGAALGLTTVYLEKYNVGARGADWELTLLERLVLAGRNLVFYAGKLTWPFDLSFIYPRIEVDLAEPWQWLPLLLTCATALILFLLRRRIGRGPLSALLYFAVTLAPALGFFDVYPFRFSYVADHFQYLASLGFLALVVVPLATALARHRAGPILAVAVVLALGARSFDRARIFRDAEALWRDTLARNPTAWIAHNNLAQVLASRGDLDEATQHFEAAIRLVPDDPRFLYNLARLREDEGRVADAIPLYLAAIEHDPRHIDSRYNLANLLTARGEVEQAIDYYRSVIELLPRHAKAHTNLGSVLAAMGRLDEAAHHLAEAVRLDPDDAQMRYNLGKGYTLAGRTDQAIAELRRALELDPAYLRARDALDALLTPERGSPGAPRR